MTHVIAGSLGEKAQSLLAHKGIEVIAGAPLEAPEALVEKYLKQDPDHQPPGTSRQLLPVHHGLMGKESS